MLAGLDLDVVLAAPAAAVLDLGYALIVEDATDGFAPRATARTAVDRWLAGLPPETSSGDPERFDDGSTGPPPSPSPTPAPDDPTTRAEDIPGWGTGDDVGTLRALAAVGGSPDQIPSLPALGVPPPPEGGDDTT